MKRGVFICNKQVTQVACEYRRCDAVVLITHGVGVYRERKLTVRYPALEGYGTEIRKMDSRDHFP